MAIIKIGSMKNFTAAFPKLNKKIATPEKAAEAEEALDALLGAPLPGMQPLSLLRESSKSLKAEPLEFAKSGEPRGIALKSIKLTKGFEGFIESVYNQTNEIYFLAWAWDFSGNPPHNYPDDKTGVENCLIPLGVGDIREFLGSGIVLFPSRIVTAGISMRIMIWESDQGVRNFGYTIKKVSKTIRKSSLNKVLSNLSYTTVTTSTLNTIKDAAFELADIIGGILEKNSDDYVDLFEGYYPVSEEWTAGEETYDGYATEINLTRMK